MKYTTTVADYLTWRGDIPFSVDPFNEVDNLVLCIISYINFRRFPELLTRNPREAVSLRDICQKLTQEDEQLGLSQLSYIPVAQQAAQTERFAGTRMFAFEDRSDQETQFAAVTFLLPDKSVFVAFRGTDTSLVGWKEDFNMSYLETVPSQREAARYLAAAATKRGEKLRLGGHSKGGNLAVYAAATAKPAVQERILGVYNNDGPGFCGGLLESAGYRAIGARVHTYLPQSSIVGMLFSHEEDYTVVHSEQMGIMQHDPYSWEVLGADFVTLERVTASSRFVDKTVKEWVARMSVPEREKLFDTLYSVLGATGAETWEELSERWFRSARAVLQKCGELDGESRKMIGRMISGLLRASTSGLRELLPGRGEGK